jgi:hypothetical protein
MERSEGKNIEIIDPEFMNLMDKLFVTKKVYHESADRLTDDILKEKMKQMSSRKEVYIKEIAHLFDFDLEQIEDELLRRMEVEPEKIHVEIDHLILEKNEEHLLDYVLDREGEVTRIYHEILNDEGYSDLENTIIKSQINENSKHLAELREIKESFNAE